MDRLVVGFELLSSRRERNLARLFRAIDRIRLDEIGGEDDKPLPLARRRRKASSR
jgi:hypothetical protein